MYTPYIIVFTVYFLIVLLVGYVSTHYTHHHADFVLGGRRFGPLIVALGAGASDMSGWLLLALPGAVYTSGINALWLPVGLALGAGLNWTFVAKRLRIYTEKAHNSLTIPSFFENRFHDTTGALRLITSIVVILFFTFYVSSGFVSGAILFETTFGINYHFALFIGAAIIIFYTSMGGFLAVNWLDLFQGTLMWLALLLVPIVTFLVLFKAPEASSVLHQVTLSTFTFSSHSAGWMAAISLFAWGLGYCGQPHILVRFMAIKDHNHIPRSTLICMSWMVMSLAGAVLTGLLGHFYFAAHPLANPESVFLQLSKVLFNPYLTGFLLAAVLSAVMSTIAAQLLASSSSLAEDIYYRYFRRQASPRELLLVNRIAVVIIALLALSFALNPHSTVLNLVGYAWGGLGASFGPLILCSLFWKHTTVKGALAGIVTGAAVIIIWKQLYSLGGIFELYEIVPAFLASLVTIIGVSLKTQKPNAQTLEIFEEYQRELTNSY